MTMRLAYVRCGLRILSAAEACHVWAQGCSRGCPQCCNTEFQDPDGGFAADPHALAQRIASRTALRLLVLSGGEPFDQAPAFAALAGDVRALRPDVAVVAYTGYTHEELAGRPDARALLACVDVLVDGPYDAASPASDGVRGSTGQRVIQLASRISAGALGRAESLRFEIVEDEGVLRFIGVPPRDWEVTLTSLGV